MGLPNTPQNALILGNYCHDILIKDDVVLAETLGGAVAFVSAVLDNLTITSDCVSKVGQDFKYTAKTTNHPPIVSQSGKTAVFHAYFVSDPSEIRREDRVLKRVESGHPIHPTDLPNELRFKFGMAVGVSGEISPETLQKMLDICDVVFADIQSLIRVFDKTNGTVTLVNLKQSGFFHLINRIGFLKASAEEAPYVDIEEVRKLCCVVVTNGKDGCTVYWKDGEVQISPFETGQVDPTGAGDSFLGGFVAGLVHGLSVPDAALVGNFFGSLTVGQIGLPEFDSRVMQKVKEEVQARKLQYDSEDDELRFKTPTGHQQFIASLCAAKFANQVVDPDPEYSNQPMLFLKNSLLEEPLKAVDTKP